MHTRFSGAGVRVDVGYQDHRRTSSNGEIIDYMLDVPLVPDVPLFHRHETRSGIKFGIQNETIQTIRRRFWDRKGNNNFYKLLPGDDLIVKCAHSTREAIQPIFGGMNSNEELCFAFISYVNKNRNKIKWAGEQDKNDRLEHDFECEFLVTRLY